MRKWIGEKMFKILVGQNYVIRKDSEGNHIISS